MSSPHQRWIQQVLSSSLVRPPPQNLDQKQTEILAYVELFAQCASESFGHDISELVRSHYPHTEAALLDDVLATFILHHPEHGHSILHALLSCILDGTLVYSKNSPPFGSFVSLFSPSCEHLQKDVSEQWALACGEILRVLTHYNRPVSNSEVAQIERLLYENDPHKECSSRTPQSHQDPEKKTLTRLLTPWITDSLLAAPLGVKSDYFRWCGGVMGKYAAGGELKPPTTVGSKGPGKHPQLMPSTPRWAVANGAAVILSVCDDEVLRYETAELTAAAVPALLLPPPATALDDHLVAGLPPLEPFARLFHRYYAIATPGATQRLFLGLLEAPPSWAPDALDAAVQLVELLRSAEDYTSTMQLPRNWLHLHFLRPVGAALAMRSGIAADAAAALLFRVFSQPALLFPAPGHAQDLHGKQSLPGASDQLERSVREQMAESAARATEEATARGIASLMCDHGPDVEWQICTLWEAAYGLLPLDSSAANLPELVIATPLQPPLLSWNLFRPLLRVLEYLPNGSPSEACLLRIFTATVEVILQRTIPCEDNQDTKNGVLKYSNFGTGSRLGLRQVASTELRAMVHSLFTEACPSADLSARLLSMAFTVCLSHDAVHQDRNKSSFTGEEYSDVSTSPSRTSSPRVSDGLKQRGAVATFDSYVVAAVCALACEVQLLTLTSPMVGTRKQRSFQLSKYGVSLPESGTTSTSLQVGVSSAVTNARRLLRLLEALLSLVPQSSYVVPVNGSTSSGEIVAAAVVAAHISEVLEKSKACTQALRAIQRCTWEPKLSAKAAAVLHLVENNRKVVTAVVDSSRSYNVKKEMNVESSAENLDEANTNLGIRKRGQIQCSSMGSRNSSEKAQAHSCSAEWDKDMKGKQTNDLEMRVSEQGFSGLPKNVSDVVSILCMDKNDASHGNIGTFITRVLRENEDLSIAAVPLLCKGLLTEPEVPTNGEGTSAKKGWRQVVEALCNIVSVYPEKAAAAIMFQVKKDLQPWVRAHQGPDSADIWQANKRIVCLLSELLRLHNVPEAIKIIAENDDALARATEGLTVDGEACTIPQLELLEAIAIVTQHLALGESCTVESLSILLKMRLPAIVRCLSHGSAHVRALSIALLQNEVYSTSASMHDQREKSLEDEWKLAVANCVAQEIITLQAMGMPVSMLLEAASSLGCCVPA
ncbi:hypothetical protein KP509_25G015300 [Ceratopteris richardii]|uniref:GIGANTEA n=1 Tax=Ceratopteris richardii TaxID=49495 RepID=A0A8T2RPC2_CERRI|nr:hypothetical protein KP509_25G015300 [Ceratopteris richardii]KAH7297851.1 hypothetical protein KP509_25G015300 [Ceratopteris richardii]